MQCSKTQLFWTTKYGLLFNLASKGSQSNLSKSMRLLWPFQGLLHCSKNVMTVMTHSSMHRCNKYLCWHIVQAAIIGLREQHSHNSCCRIDLGFWQQNRFCIICKQLSLCGSPDSQSCAYFQYQWFTVISQGSFFSSSCSPKAHRSAISKQVNPWESEINMLVRFADQNSFHMFSKTVLLTIVDIMLCIYLIKMV